VINPSDHFFNSGVPHSKNLGSGLLMQPID